MNELIVPADWAGQVLALRPESVALLAAIDRSQSAARPAPRTSGGIAVIPVQGVLSQKGSLFSTSIEGIEREIRAAAADPEVRAIVLDVDSPGGSVFGVQSAADAVHEAASIKRVIAVANPMMCSAAYWLSSAASEIVAAPSAYVGSIGVFGTHVSVGAMYEKFGVKVTLVSAGKYKTEGNPYEELSEEARGQMQKDVDALYDQFVRAVARGRNVSLTAVREGYGEGRALLPDDAKAAGLIDRTETMAQVMGRLQAWRPRAMRALADDPIFR